VRHHGFADGLGGDFVLAEIFEVAHDLGHGLLDPFRVDIALAQRDHHRTRELVAVERHPPSVALDDREFAQLHPLERGEPEPAGETQPPAPDRRGILGRPGILDLGVEAGAAWAAHRAFPVRRRSESAPTGA
jgi:hypothetical protein